MAKPVAAYVQLPTDAGNTGKQIRTQTRVVSGQTVHEHYFVRGTQRTVDGIYYGDGGAVASVSATATNGTTTGLLWLYNLAGSTVNLAVRRIKVEHTVSASTAMPTNPRIALALGTFTGTPSGTALAIAKRATADAAAQASLRSTQAGATVTLGNIVISSVPIVIAGTAGLTIVQSNFVELLHPDESAPDDEKAEVVLATGECLIAYQPDAGTTADTRRLDIDLSWEEFDNA